MSSYDLVLNATDDPNVVHVSLAGELDLTNAQSLEDQLAEIAAPAALLIVDLNQVLFIDSAALHVLFRLAGRRDKDALGFVLDPSSPITRTLTIVSFGQAARIAATYDDLVSSIATA